MLVGELLAEIMAATGVRAFEFDLAASTARLADALADEKYFTFIARDGNGNPAGTINMSESYALYAEGSFGTIQELYVRPAYRSAGVGRGLIAAAREFGRSRDWKRLEVTTPRLPEFDRTLAFYEREGFSIAGGRKLKVAL